MTVWIIVFNDLDVLFNGNNTDNNEQDLLEFLSAAKSSDYIIEPSNDQSLMIEVDSISRGKLIN